MSPANSSARTSPEMQVAAESEMAVRIHDLDWAARGLGSPADWPACLQTVLRIMLTSRLPMALYWGPRGIFLYNDAYVPIAGPRHPGVLGEDILQAWPEVAEFNRHVLKVVLGQGGSLTYRDQELLLHRNGPERVWLDLHFSPVLDDRAQPAGVLVMLQETTQRVLAERSLHEQQQRLQRMVEMAPGLMAMLEGPEHRLAVANPAFYQLAAGQISAGTPLRELLPGQDALLTRLDEVYRSGGTHVGKATPILLPTGETRLLDLVLQPVSDGDGKVSGLFIEGFDVTERVQTQRRLRDSEARLRALVHTSSDLLYRVDRDWQELCLPYAEEGAASCQAVRTWIAQRVHPDDRQALRDTILEACRRPAFFELEHRLAGERGEYIWMQLRAVPLFDAEGDVLEWFIAFSDISIRKRAEEALRENERRLEFLDHLTRATLSASDPDEILSRTTALLGEHLGVARCLYADCTADGSLEVRCDWSPVGAPLPEAFGSWLAEQLTDRQPLVISALDAAPAAGVQALLCVPLVQDRRLNALLALIDDQPRHWNHYEMALLGEVTERCWTHLEPLRSQVEAREQALRFVLELEAKVAERTAALAESEAKLRAIFETSHQYQGLLDAEGRVLFLNLSALNSIQSRLEDQLGKPFWETPWFTTTEGMPERIRDAVERVAAGGIDSQSVTLHLPIGVRSFDFSLRPVLDETGAVVAMVPEAVDKTARLQAEQHLQQVQKMEALGRLTGSIAHDFNNLLMIVLGSLELLRRRLPDDPALLRLVDTAKAGAERGATLTARMLAFARKQDLRQVTIDLRELVEDMHDMFERSLGPAILLGSDFPDALPCVRTDPNQLETALLNLLVNARDAMNAQGSIRIAASTHELLNGEHGLSPGRYVCLSVTDSGVGMEESVLKRATEPFFTTKGVGKGTGLGLSMVHGLALQSGGTLVLNSQPGKGTTAQIWLPALDEAAEFRARPRLTGQSAAPLTPPRRLTILVVDDDELVLRNTAEMLAEPGHQVVTARSAADALKMLDQLQVDLVVSDHAMPHMTGMQLAERLRQSHPQLPVILVSGYAELSPEHELDLPRLAKPFSQKALLDLVAQTLAHSSSSAA